MTHSFQLQKKSAENPLLLIIMDGVGVYKGQAEGYPGNAWDQARTPALDHLLANAPVYTQIKAHGTAVGLPSDDDMGNSEVGHNAMGAGRVFDQGAKLVSKAIESRAMFTDKAWQKLIGTQAEPGLALEKGVHGDRAVHFIGLLSDGNVHSHIDHLMAMIDECAAQKVPKLYVHALLDGRDVEEVSAHKYIKQLEEKLQSINGQMADYAIASGGGRMKVTMDRYEADWDMVQLGWQTHVKGQGPLYESALQAIDDLRQQNPGVIDQDLPPFVIGKNGQPVGRIQDDDVVIFFNFRGDRAIEISRAFTEKDFTPFDRDPNVAVHFAGMMEYDGDLAIPPLYLVSPPTIDKTVSEYLARNKIKQFAISETQKYGHVTYFWNGNNSEKFDHEYEVWQEIKSDKISFDQKPRMKADEIADALIKALESNDYTFLRVNFANGDMVGHTGVLEAAIQAVEAVDQNLQRLIAKAEDLNYTVIVTADHGNCDQMIEVDKKTGQAKKNANGKYAAKTSHTLNPVPFIVAGKDAAKWKLSAVPDSDPGLGNIAPTILTMLGYEPPQGYLPSLVEKK